MTFATLLTPSVASDRSLFRLLRPVFPNACGLYGIRYFRSMFSELKFCQTDNMYQTGSIRIVLDIRANKVIILTSV